MDTDFEVLEDTYNSLEIIENGMFICQILPIILIGVFSIVINQILPWIHISLVFAFSILLSWLAYCVFSVKFLLKAMIYSEERKVLYDFATSKKLLIKDGYLSYVFYTSRKDNNELNELLSNPHYKRNSIELKIKTSLIYLLFLLLSSITLGAYISSFNIETRAEKIRFWTVITIASWSLIYSIKGLLTRKPKLTLLPQGILLPEKNIITFDKIRDFKIIKRSSGRHFVKYITFQHLTSYLGSDTYIYEEINFQNCNISTRKMNYFYDLNLKNYNR